ncbi:hypothetical protein KAR91_62020 [Candidatus Pacearchaeota archaeon]|nr:hypothetical protein [Candidatus Pacearchaeota archaeon]
MAKRNSKLETRDNEIYALRAAGMSMPKIGKKYGVTRARIRQIIHEVERRRHGWHRRQVAEAAIGSGKSVEVTALALPWRIETALAGAGITHTDQLFSMSKLELLMIRGMGRKSVDALEDLFLKYDKWDRGKWL